MAGARPEKGCRFLPSDGDDETERQAIASENDLNGSMSGAAIEYVFAGIPVTDYSSAIAWYSAVFGRPPDVIVREGHESMWELKPVAWVYVVRDPERAGKALVTILVDDIESEVSTLTARGITDIRREALPSVYMKAILTDSDGNMVTFAEALSDAKGG